MKAFHWDYGPVKRHKCSLAFFLLCVQFIYSNSLDCYSEPYDEIAPVNCTAVKYQQDNCSESYLKEQYPDLFGLEYWPDRPHDLQTVPIQEEWEKTINLYPGFIFYLYPSHSVSIKYVRGFQLNYKEVKSGLTKCVIVRITNATLTSEHRNLYHGIQFLLGEEAGVPGETHRFSKNLTFKLKIWPMVGVTDFIFTAWSLPKPPQSEADVQQTRYGRTGIYGILLDPSSSADWVTTISFYNNLKEKSIQIWFAPAPKLYGFLEYTVTLERIIEVYGNSTENRETSYNTRITETEYTFRNVEPGKYRAAVEPYDDNSNSLTQCRCKTKIGGCVRCIKTVTSVIEVNAVLTSTTAVTAEQTSTKLTRSTFADVKSAVGDQSTQNPDTTSSGDQSTKNRDTTSSGDQSTKNPDTTPSIPEHVLPSVLGFVAFIMVVVIVVAIYKFRKSEEKNTNQQQQRTSPYRQDIPNQFDKCRNISVAIAFTEDNKFHNKVVHCFAVFLQKQCCLDVVFYPWSGNEDKFRWITTTIENVDFIIIVISQSGIEQYNTWIHSNTFLKKESSDLFMSFLKAVLNRSVQNPNFSKKLIMVQFNHTKDIVIPNTLSMNHFVLNKELKEFLCYLHGRNAYKNDLSLIRLPTAMSRSKEVRDLDKAITQAVKMGCSKISDASGNRAFDDTLSIQSAVTVNPEEYLSHSDVSTPMMGCCKMPGEIFDWQGFIPPLEDGSSVDDISCEDLLDDIRQLNNRNCRAFKDCYIV